MQEIEDRKSFHDYRTHTVKQRLFLDWLTKQGVFRNVKGTQITGCYGGAGWGGKSYVLRSAAWMMNFVLRSHGVWNPAGVITTSTYDMLMDRHVTNFAREFKGLGEVLNTQVEGYHVKWFGDGMGITRLRNAPSITDTRGHGASSKRGGQNDYGFVDESTEITYGQFDAFLYTVRPRDAGLPFLTVGAATNPDGIGHAWNKKVFHPAYRDVNHPYFTNRDPRTVLFVQALKTDNPAYAQMKSVIDANMEGIEDPEVRRARNNGDWDLYLTGRFSHFRCDSMRPEKNIHGFHWGEFYDRWGIPEELTPLVFMQNAQAFGFQIWTSLDYGTSANSVSAYLMWLVDAYGHSWYVGQLPMIGLQLPDQAEKIKEFESGMKIFRRIGDPASLGARASEEQSGLTRLDRFSRLGLVFHLGINDRVEGWATCDDVLYFKRNAEGVIEKGPKCRFLFAETRYGRMWGVPALITEIADLPRLKSNPEDVDPMGGKWHWADSWRYGQHTYRTALRRNQVRSDDFDASRRRSSNELTLHSLLVDF
jgi:hypothetical protein